jgi:hypothetical protein
MVIKVEPGKLIYAQTIGEPGMLDKKVDFFGAMEALSKGKTITSLCPHHTYKVIDGKIQYADKELTLKYNPEMISVFLTDEELNGDWFIYGDEKND